MISAIIAACMVFVMMPGEAITSRAAERSFNNGVTIYTGDTVGWWADSIFLGEDYDNKSEVGIISGYYVLSKAWDATNGCWKFTFTNTDDDYYNFTVDLTPTDEGASEPTGVTCIGCGDEFAPLSFELCYTPLINVTGVSLDHASLTVNDVSELNATITPSNATDKNLIWSVTEGSDKISLYENYTYGWGVPTYAIAATKVYIKAKAAGTATIKVQSAMNPSISATCTVTVDPKFNVTITGGANATRTGGAVTQTNLSGAMTTVTYTANEGYMFDPFKTPDRYDRKSVNGVTMRWVNSKTITVSGTPTTTTSVTVPDAVEGTCLELITADQINAQTFPLELNDGDYIIFPLSGYYYKPNVPTPLYGMAEDYHYVAKVADGKLMVDTLWNLNDSRSQYTKAEASTWMLGYESGRFRFYERTRAAVTTAPEANNPTYNGSEQALVSSGVSDGGTMQYVIGTDDTTPPSLGWSEEVPKATNADDYYVWYRAVGDGINHSDSATGVVTATIGRKNVTITPDAKSKDAGEADPELTYQVTGLCGNETLTGVSIQREPGEAAGRYRITVTVDDTLNPNYAVDASATADFTINAEQTGGDEQKPAPEVNVLYSSHIQNQGWEKKVSKNGAVSGTTGGSLRMEAFVAKVDGNKNLGIQYAAHVQDYGWMPWAANGEIAGTSGESKRMEAVMIKLTGADQDKFDIYYRVHAQNLGWLGWSKNGEAAGTAGYGYRLEALQIQIVPKGKAIEQNAAGIKSVKSERYASKDKNQQPVVSGSDKVSVSYKTHVQNDGWQSWKSNGAVSGTYGRSLRLEGININLSNKDYTGGVRYKTHVQNIGWEKMWHTDGETAGTYGKSLRLEAIDIELYGEMAEHYDVYYRVHCQNYGWLAWAKNGEHAGTSGRSYRLEGIQVVLVPKGGAVPAANYGGVITNTKQAYLPR